VVSAVQVSQMFLNFRWDFCIFFSMSVALGYPVVGTTKGKYRDAPCRQFRRARHVPSLSIKLTWMLV